MQKNWTEEQNEFFKKLTNTSSNICINSTAGSGKTTTLVEAVKRLGEGKKILLLSFTNTIVSELKDRLIGHKVDISTLHSKGLGVLKQTRNFKINDNKSFNYFSNLYKIKFPNLGYKEMYKEVFKVQSVFNFLRMTLCQPILSKVLVMCDYYNIDASNQNILDAIEAVPKLSRSSEIDFIDMVYLPAIKKDPKRGTYDYVILDEAQDINRSQESLLLSFLKPKGRLICTGDTYQSIYGFAGSTVDSFKRLMERENTIVLPLTISFRCAKQIVSEANTICPSMRAYCENPQGVVKNADIGEIKRRDMVLCRTTAPLIELFFQLLVEDIPSTVVGKNIEIQLLSLLEQSRARTTEQFEEFLQSEVDKLYFKLERQGIIKIDKHPLMERLEESVNILKCILERCNTFSELERKITDIFSEKKDCAKLMTVHRAKGLESERVFIIREFDGIRMMPYKSATTPLEIEQENNLIFVAITRAKSELNYIDLISYNKDEYWEEQSRGVEGVSK